MERATDHFIKRLKEENMIDGLGPLKIRYALSLIKNEAVKLSLLIAIFYLIGLLMPLLFTMVIIVPIRITAGGLHFQSNIGCFLASLSFFLLSVAVLPQLAFQSTTYMLILLASGAAICMLPLAPSVKRPIVSRGKYRFNKYLSVLFALTVMLSLLFFVDNQYLVRYGVWALFLQAIQLVYLAVIKKIRRDIYV